MDISEKVQNIQDTTYHKKQKDRGISVGNKMGGEKVSQVWVGDRREAKTARRMNRNMQQCVCVGGAEGMSRKSQTPRILEALPGTNGDDLSQNAHQWGDGTLRHHLQ